MKWHSAKDGGICGEERRRSCVSFLNAENWCQYLQYRGREDWDELDAGSHSMHPGSVLFTTGKIV